MDGGAWQDGLPSDLVIRRSTRARRISLRVSALDGRVSLTVPAGVPDAEALAFARSKSDWIAKHRAAQAADVKLDIGAEVPFLGASRRVVAAHGKRVCLQGDEISVPAGAPAAGLAAFFKTQARTALVAASDRYAACLGKPYSRITLRDTRSRWGSCSSQGRLMYSWRLIMMPPEVLDYVAAHEVAHLQHMDHSRAFWECVSSLYGDFDPPRRWLRDHGGQVHRYRF